MERKTYPQRQSLRHFQEDLNLDDSAFQTFKQCVRSVVEEYLDVRQTSSQQSTQTAAAIQRIGSETQDIGINIQDPATLKVVRKYIRKLHGGRRRNAKARQDRRLRFVSKDNHVTPSPTSSPLNLQAANGPSRERLSFHNSNPAPVLAAGESTLTITNFLREIHPSMTWLGPAMVLFGFTSEAALTMLAREPDQSIVKVIREFKRRQHKDCGRRGAVECRKINALEETLIVNALMAYRNKPRTKNA